jgi:hypothetical protein
MIDSPKSPGYCSEQVEEGCSNDERAWERQETRREMQHAYAFRKSKGIGEFVFYCPAVRTSVWVNKD